MRAIWCWLAAETILSDSSPTLTWTPNALLQRPSSQSVYSRQGWDEAPLQEFGPWRFGPKPDPLAGQTEQLAWSGEAADDAPVSAQEEPTLSEAAEASAPVFGLSQEELDHLLAQARESAWQEGHAAGVAQMAASVQVEREALASTAQALNTLQSDRAQMLEPLKKLSIHIARELVRGELKLGPEVIERLIHECVQALDQPTETVLVQVSPADLQRLHGLTLPGVTLESDDSLSEGSVRAKVRDTQVQDLIEHRLAHIAKQILGDG